MSKYFFIIISFVIAGCSEQGSKDINSNNSTKNFEVSFDDNYIKDKWDTLSNKRLYVITGQSKYPDNFSGYGIFIFDRFIGSRSIIINTREEKCIDGYIYENDDLNNPKQDSLKIFYPEPTYGWKLFTDSIKITLGSFKVEQSLMSHKKTHDGTFFVIDLYQLNEKPTRIKSFYCKQMNIELVNFLNLIKRNFPDKRTKIHNFPFDDLPLLDC